MLSEWLGKEWLARCASTPIDPVMRFSDEGLVLGAGTVLAPAATSDRSISMDRLELRLLALLAAAHRRTPTAAALAHIRKAIERRREGEEALAAMHLALSLEARLEQPEADAHRLFLADGLLDAGVDAETILKALDLGASAVELLSRYSPDQPRVPAGSGRASGQWTNGDAGESAGPQASAGRPHPVHPHRPATPAAHPPHPKAQPKNVRPDVRGVDPHRATPSRESEAVAPAAPSMAITIGRPVAVGLDLAAMSGRALSAVATFIAGATEVSATAATAGVATAAGVLFIPSTGPTGKWVKVPGSGNISYFRNPDEPGLTFRYTTADGVKREWRAELTDGPGGGGYRGPDGRIIARWVKTSATAGLVVSTAALLGNDSDDGKLCPAPVKDNGSKLGQAYEDFLKAQFNPGNPTPSGLAYQFRDPETGKLLKIDDCQQRTGALGEYKGPGYEEHLLKKDFVWDNMLKEMLRQATEQSRAAGPRPLIWFADEKAVVRELRQTFKDNDLKIIVVWMRMPRASK